jgi:molecular chaperone IbpA
MFAQSHSNTYRFFQEDISMRTTFDFSPLYRSAIGFDRLAELFDNSLAAESQPSYPPYNIELVGEAKYRITMAVAGFTRAEIEVESERDTLKIIGRKEKDAAAKTYLHRGLAARNFEQRFQLADHVKVVNASLDNGLLNIDLVREIPEAMKPRKIAISGGETASNVERLERAAA